MSVVEQSDGKKVLCLKTCEVMQYWEYMDCNELAVVVSRIKTLTNLKSFCIITHDKDLLPSGKPKPPHFHAVLTFKNAKTVDSIAKVIGVETQFVNTIKKTTKSAQLYLVHRNDPDKYQYNPADVIADFDYESMADECPPKQKRESIANRIANGEIKEYNLHKHITVDEYSRNKRYYINAFEYRQNTIKGTERNMKCYFITGASETGKTTYAKILASQLGYTAYVSSGGKNPLDNYKGEECIILDDTRSSSWSLTDFLKLTDNHTDSLVGCRYYNKYIGECRLIIVTSVKSIDQFYDDATKEHDEPKIQLLRRFELLITMERDTMTLSPYDSTKQRHVPTAKCINPVSMMYQPKKATEVLADFMRIAQLEILTEGETAVQMSMLTPTNEIGPF